MFEGQTQDPELFIKALRQYHETDKSQRGEIANALSDLVISKRIDLAEVRQRLAERQESSLSATLQELLDLIEPYIEEGGVDE